MQLRWKTTPGKRKQQQGCDTTVSQKELETDDCGMQQPLTKREEPRRSAKGVAHAAPNIVPSGNAPNMIPI
jgi:hypothetical protein